MSLSCFIFMLKEALKRAPTEDSFLVRIMCLARECSSRRAGGWGEAHPPESSAFSEKGEKRKGTKEEGESAGGPTHEGQNQNSPSKALVVQFTANGGEYFANLAHFRCRSVRQSVSWSSTPTCRALCAFSSLREVTSVQLTMSGSRAPGNRAAARP